MVLISPINMSSLLLVFARCAGALLLLPPWNWRQIPLTVRLGLAAAVALALTPVLATPPAALDLAPLVAGLLRELTVGLSLGFLGALVFWGLLLAGQIMEHYAGGGSVSLDEEDLGPVAKLYYLLALVIFILIGGQRWLVEQLFRSYAAVPLGAPVASGAISTAIGAAAGQMFTIGLVSAAPVLTALFLADVVLATVARAAPNLAWAPVLPAIRWPVALVALVITLPLLGHFVGGQFAVLQSSLQALLGGM